MLVLASDTTGKSLSVALVKDGCLVGESRFNLGYNHAVTHLHRSWRFWMRAKPAWLRWICWL
jgi:tRNA A37 threonylcarbamoyladenosine modification protein TsaB